MNMLDNDLRSVWRKSPNALIAWVLMSSYAYYQMDSPILEDSTYDNICKHLYDKWDDYTHPHKHLIERESLRQGSLFYLKEEDYPKITKVACKELVEKCYGDFRGRSFMEV